jgi:hypothetical protein
LKFQYPLYIVRLDLREKDESSLSERFAIVDSAKKMVAVATDHESAYELVRLANSAYKLFADLTTEPPNVHPRPTPRNLRWAEACAWLPDPSW